MSTGREAKKSKGRSLGGLKRGEKVRTLGGERVSGGRDGGVGVG